MPGAIKFDPPAVAKEIHACCILTRRLQSQRRTKCNKGYYCYLRGASGRTPYSLLRIQIASSIFGWTFPIASAFCQNSSGRFARFPVNLCCTDMAGQAPAARLCSSWHRRARVQRVVFPTQGPLLARAMAWNTKVQPDPCHPKFFTSLRYSKRAHGDPLGHFDKITRRARCCSPSGGAKLGNQAVRRASASIALHSSSHMAGHIVKVL